MIIWGESRVGFSYPFHQTPGKLLEHTIFNLHLKSTDRSIVNHAETMSSHVFQTLCEDQSMSSGIHSVWQSERGQQLTCPFSPRGPGRTEHHQHQVPNIAYCSLWQECSSLIPNPNQHNHTTYTSHLLHCGCISNMKSEFLGRSHRPLREGFHSPHIVPDLVRQHFLSKELNRVLCHNYMWDTCSAHVIQETLSKWDLNLHRAKGDVKPNPE